MKRLKHNFIATQTNTFLSFIFGSIYVFYYLCGMETVYDYNPTKEEWNQLCYMPRDRYERIVGDDSRNLDLALLFHIRGKKRKWKKYISKVKNVDMVNSFYRTIYHP